MDPSKDDQLEGVMGVEATIDPLIIRGLARHGFTPRSPLRWVLARRLVRDALIAAAHRMAGRVGRVAQGGLGTVTLMFGVWSGFADRWCRRDDQWRWRQDGSDIRTALDDLAWGIPGEVQPLPRVEDEVTVALDLALLCSVPDPSVAALAACCPEVVARAVTAIGKAAAFAPPAVPTPRAVVAHSPAKARPVPSTLSQWRRLVADDRSPMGVAVLIARRLLLHRPVSVGRPVAGWLYWSINAGGVVKPKVAADPDEMGVCAHTAIPFTILAVDNGNYRFQIERQRQADGSLVQGGEAEATRYVLFGHALEWARHNMPTIKEARRRVEAMFEGHAVPLASFIPAPPSVSDGGSVAKAQTDVTEVAGLATGTEGLVEYGPNIVAFRRR